MPSSSAAAAKLALRAAVANTRRSSLSIRLFTIRVYDITIQVIINTEIGLCCGFP
jgi:hypothetical protein